MNEIKKVTRLNLMLQFENENILEKRYQQAEGLRNRWLEETELTLQMEDYCRNNDVYYSEAAFLRIL